MRSLWIILLSLIISITSIGCEQPSVEFGEDQLSSIHAIPSWETDSLRLSETKHTEKNNHIAQDFIPIVIIADQWVLPVNFHHYIPLYSLVREKEFNLLI